MPLPSKLTKYTTASPILATYNWEDANSGVGYQVLYGGCLDVQGAATADAINLIITPNIFTSSKQTIKGTDVYTDVANLDEFTDKTATFTSKEFSQPQIMEGGLLIEYVISRAASTTSLTCKVYKNSTEIASSAIAHGETDNSATGLNAEITIPRTNFSIGDTLSIEFILVGTNTAIYFDPSNTSPRDFNGYGSPTNSYLKFNIPWEINR